MKKICLITFIGLGILFGTLFLLTRENQQNTTSKTPDIDLDIGAKPPDFQVKTVDGKQVSLANLSGKPVILESYAFWCPSCLLEAANLSEAALPYKDKVEIIAFTFDPSETEEGTEEFKEATRGFGGEGAFWDFVLYNEGKKVIFDYKKTGPDFTYIINKEGRISYKDRGLTNPETFRREIQKVI